jgi:hypothetical protein
MKLFNRENVNKESNKGGVYAFYDKNGKRIYAGRASGKVGEPWGDNPNGGRFRYGLKHSNKHNHKKSDGHGH